MSDTTMSTRLVQTWVPATDVQGRTRLEARWTQGPRSGVPTQTPRAA
jgi:hypothetical protein